MESSNQDDTDENAINKVKCLQMHYTNHFSYFE